jgi:hypothetical protein
MHKSIADLVATFDKSIKGDRKDFPMILDIKDWDKFRQGMQATGKNILKALYYIFFKYNSLVACASGDQINLGSKYQSE